MFFAKIWKEKNFKNLNIIVFPEFIHIDFSLDEDILNFDFK